MANKNITLTYYEIDKLGFFDHSGKNYSSAKLVLNGLKEWAYDSSKPLVETSTYTGTKNQLEAYCLDFYEKDGDYIFALWNRVPSGKKGIASVSSKSTSRNAAITHTTLGKDSIPGYPTFFWMSPDKKLFATIKLDNHVLGISQFRQYIKGYLRHFSKHMVDREDGDDHIYGLAKESKPTEGKDLRFPDKSIYPSFKISSLTQPMSEKYLIENAFNITKVVKDISTNTLTYDPQQSLIEGARRWYDGIPLVDRGNSRVTLPVKLGYSHVQDFIKEYHDNKCDDEYNLGFIMRGDTTIHWLNGTVRTENISGDLTMHNAEQPQLESLMKLIDKIGEVKIDSLPENKDVA